MLFFSQILIKGIAMTEFYEIRVEGHLDPQWSAWFAGLELTYPAADETLLSGTAARPGRAARSAGAYPRPQSNVALGFPARPR